MFGAAGSWYYSTLAGLDRAPHSRAWTDLVIAPPGADDVLAQLSFASASIDSSMGPVAAAWTKGTAPSVGAVCAEGAEKAVLNLRCAGGAFTGVAFAAFGTPSGGCTAAPPAKNASCDAAGAAAVVAKLCVGKTACAISVDDTTFGGDPCFDVVKHAIVALDGPCSNVEYSVSATVPVGARASVRVPTRGAAAGAAIISESDVVVWRAGAFVPGAAGIAGATEADGAVTFSVGSGVYAFELTFA